jgi:diguanylate cyclase (GGDEF)-like protein/PAS domain S-box-containing protein
MWIRDPVRALRTALSWRRLIYNLLSLVVVLSMLAVTYVAWTQSRQSGRVELLMNQVRTSDQELSTYIWQTVAQQSAKPRSAPAPTRAELLAIEAPGRRIYNQLTEQLNELERLAGSRLTLAILSDAQQLNRDAVALLPVIAGREQPRQAAELTKNTLVPDLTQLDQVAQAAAAEQAAIANTSAAHAEWIFGGALVAGLFLLLLLGARLSRLRQKSALIEERRAVEIRAERRLRGLIEHSSDIILVVNADLTVRWQSNSAQRDIATGTATLVGHRVTSLVHEDDAAAIEEALRALPRRGGTTRLTVRFKVRNGVSSHYEVIADDHLEDPDVEGIVLSMRDVTERMALEDELRHQAFHDSLTGLANRALFEDRLVHCLAGAAMDQRLVAVLFLDLDNFKTINDSLGHIQGDELLRAVAKRIGRSVAASDTAARLGGDEFAVLIENVSGEEEARERALVMLDELVRPFNINDRDFHVSVSIGVAFSDGRTRAEELLRNADTAMYAAKDAGKRTVEVFNRGMHQRVLARLELTEDLTQALRDGNQLELDYQPIVELDTGVIVGLEALVRWAHPLRGRLYPTDFIGLAEDNGLIVPLGEWVLQTACAQAACWREMWPERDVKINVNVSARQLHDPEFPHVVARVLDDTGLPPHLLVLEITESLLPDVGDEAIERLKRLKRLGLRIAVDDFGTGYSALSRLHDYPLDILKIDRSFVEGMENDEGKQHLVRGIVDLGRGFGMTIVAEGIELPEQADQLRRLNSGLGQGFLLSRPAAPERITELLETGVRPSAAEVRV